MAERDLDISVGRLSLAGVSASPRPRQEGLWVPTRRSFSDFAALWGPTSPRRRRMANSAEVREGGMDDDLIQRLHSLRMEIRTRKDSSIYPVTQKVFFPRSADHLQVYADEYNKACRELGKGEAGHRARNLLFEFLDESQRKDAETKGYFDVVLVPPETNETILDEIERLRLKGSHVGFSSVKFRILRYSTDVWEFNRNKRTGQWEYNFSICIHPPRPYPYDDIALGQLIELIRHPDEFVKIAQWWLDGYSLNFNGDTMFHHWKSQAELAKPLEFPYLHPRTQTIIGLDRIGRRMQDTLDAMEYLR